MKTYECPLCRKNKPLEEFLTSGNYIVWCRLCNLEKTKPIYYEFRPKAFDDTNPARIPQCAKVMAWEYSPKGLLLHGSTGKGKSRSAWKLIERLMCVLGYHVECFTGVSFGHKLAEKYRTEEAESWLRYLGAEAETVFFDDLGKLKLTERAEAELFGIIDARCQNCLPIIATTNDTGETLAARMTPDRAEPFVRRLREFCQIIDF